MRRIRILVVDDSVLYRTALVDVVEDLPMAALVGFARDGREAVERVERLRPDLVTLDNNMPVMSGLEALEAIRRSYPGTAVVMISAASAEGARETMRALEAGAIGFIAKPEGADPAANKADLKRQLEQIVQALSEKFSCDKQGASGAMNAARTPIRLPEDSSPSLSGAGPRPKVRPEIVVIGVSTGGPMALAQIIPLLPADFPVPICIVQHMPPLFTASLAESLGRSSKLSVVEASQGVSIRPGSVYIAPGGRQARLRRNASGNVSVEVNDDPPENHCKPSVDYLFRSVAQVYGSKALGVILTGMGTDGATGLRLMKRQGAQVIAQDEATCVVYGMPRAAKSAGVVDVELPLSRIAAGIASAVGA